MDGREGRWHSWWDADELLEEADVKDIVEPSARGQIKAHRDSVDELGDAVRLEEARLELPFSRLGQEGGSMMTLAEQDPIANRVGDGAVKLVGVALLDRLGLFQPIADVCEELVAVRHVLGDSNHTRLARLIGANGRRVAAIQHTEWRVTE